MKVAVFWGCRILTSQYAYEMSIRQAFPRLDVELVDLPEFHCCGDPVKSMNDVAANYLATRVLALASTTGLDNLLVPCNRCHFVASESKYFMEKNGKISQKITSLLKEEGLEYNPSIKVWHTIDFLHNLVGLDDIKKAVRKPLLGLKLATHVGCQIIRYSDLGRVDDAENPRKLDELVGALGAETVDYAEKLDCCGANLMYSHTDTALSLAGTKMKALQNLMVDGLVVSCPDCGLMFDFKQKDAEATVGAKLDLPVLYYTQLLGWSLDIEQKQLGLHLNQSPVEKLLARVSI
ncbi:MAG: CoB--CoM heterodisulfide reductase iron-sulfur subunit B family protein [Candidatus Bathyarchaeota archaeon]|nr:CoB--CoM heterodisulfide reductase iron-sulfur subunit B family protein [Candidatus Bathyarchaeota archaeon]MDH5787103.1 CoB--CoM heterodisulfide reductase iron-sulfur subunit B family protein [Candidatus Bathyarchaeota archaeon]